MTPFAVILLLSDCKSLRVFEASVHLNGEIKKSENDFGIVLVRLVQQVCIQMKLIHTSIGSFWLIGPYNVRELCKSAKINDLIWYS